MKEQDDAVALAIKTAAEHLSIAADQFRVVLVSRAEWRDTSLGCPERGMAYTQVITPGFKVTLREGDREHAVHVAGSRAVVCGSQPDARLSVAPRVESSLAAGNAVRAAISRERNIPASRVRIVSVKPARKGEPCASETPSGPAFIVEARVDKQTLRYYSDASTIRGCNPPQK